MKQLEHGVLRVCARATPGHRRGRMLDRLAVAGNGLAIRFHLQLLEIEREKAQPLVVGEHRA